MKSTISSDIYVNHYGLLLKHSFNHIRLITNACYSPAHNPGNVSL